MEKVALKKVIIEEPVGNFNIEQKNNIILAVKQIKYCEYYIGSIEDADSNADEIIKQLGINIDEIQ